MSRLSGTINITKQKLLLVCIVIAILMALPGVFFYKKYSDASNQLAHPDQTAQTQLSAIVQRISKHVLLPADEQPTMATVTDPSKLQAQPFFANAKAGDKVIVFTQSRKTVLYRPSTQKVVAIAQLGAGL